MPFLRRDANTWADSQEGNLEILRASHFSNSSLQFSTNAGDNSPAQRGISSDLSSFISYDLLNKAINELPTGKACGPDGIKNEILKSMPQNYKMEFLRLCASSLSMGFIPECWLNIDVVYIKKQGRKDIDSPKSYRPIGLSSTLLKLCERLVNWRLKATILKNGIPKQHAFSLNRSTESAISELVNVIEKVKAQKQKAMIISIDIMGAFDTVPFEVIVDALNEHGAEPELVRWIDYLSKNRVCYTKIGSACVTFRPLEGTTQGGVCGPDIWIIVIWCIIYTRAARMGIIIKFADDLISALLGTDLSTIRDLVQTCLNEINEWFTQKGLRISASKSFCMIVGKSRSEPLPKPITLNGVEVPYVSQFKYLGVIIDANLTWRPHVMSRVAKTKKDMMVAKRLVSTTWGLSPEKVIWIYKAIVRPSLDYSCHVWTPSGNFPAWMSRELDKVQRLALVCAVSPIKSTPTRALERLCNLVPLEHHLKMKSANTIARIFNAVSKSRWDGLSVKGCLSGHLFLWNKTLDAPCQPVEIIQRYNFNTFRVSIVENESRNEDISIYTDGSKIENRTGFGWVVYKGEFIITQGCVGLPDHSTVYEAECMAIIYALRELMSMYKACPSLGKVVLYADNQAALLTLLKIKVVGRLRCDLVNTVEEFETTFPGSLHFFWVKGHSNVTGNENADTLAKMGTKGLKKVHIEPSIAFMKQRTLGKSIVSWNRLWEGLSDCRQSRELITFVPSARETNALFNRTRLACRKMIALLTGHNELKYHVFKRIVQTNPTFSPCCRFCEENVETSWHLLYDCPCFEQRRREFMMGYGPDNPKKGPDITWYHSLADKLGVLDLVLDRRILDQARGEGDDFD